MHADSSPDAVIAGIRIHPIKSLDPHPIDAATLGEETGGLVGDREFAMVDPDGEYVTEKRSRAVHRIRSASEAGDIVLERPGEPAVTWTPGDPPAEIERWLSDHVGHRVELLRNRAGGFPDDTHRPGPTVISTGTIREIASWYDGMDAESVRRRFRANVEIGNVPPFWEDRLVADEGTVVAFRIGDVAIEGVNPCQRCVVPSRDPDTGEEYPRFREIFTENRRRTMPPWLDSDRFDHPFRVMVNTRVPAASRGERISVGDPVSIAGKRPA